MNYHACPIQGRIGRGAADAAAPIFDNLLTFPDGFAATLLTMRIPSRHCFPMKALGTKPLIFLFGFVAGGLPAWAGEPPVLKPALQRELESRILPEVRFHDADLTEALVYLQAQALASSQDAVRIPFAVHLPADFKPRYELTLDLKAVPFWEALRHLGGQAGVEFSIERDAVKVRPAGAATAAKATVRTMIPAPPAPAPRKMAGLLGTPAKPFGAGGNNNHYSTAGVIQPQRSGKVKNRNLSGWSVDADPGNRFSMNCVDIAACKAHRGSDRCPCGCHACACQRPKKAPETRTGK